MEVLDKVAPLRMAEYDDGHFQFEDVAKALAKNVLLNLNDITVTQLDMVIDVGVENDEVAKLEQDKQRVMKRRRSQPHSGDTSPAAAAEHVRSTLGVLRTWHPPPEVVAGDVSPDSIRSPSTSTPVPASPVPARPGLPSRKGSFLAPSEADRRLDLARRSSRGLAVQQQKPGHRQELVQDMKDVQAQRKGQAKVVRTTKLPQVRLAGHL